MGVITLEGEPLSALHFGLCANTRFASDIIEVDRISCYRYTILTLVAGNYLRGNRR